MAKKDSSGGNRSDTNVFRWPKPGGATSSGEHWSYMDLMEGALIDLSDGKGNFFDLPFMTDDVQFRVYFDSWMALQQADLFFGLAYFGLFEFIYSSPEFDQILMEFEAKSGRKFTVGVIERRAHFYLDLGNEFGLLLQLHHPETA